MTGLITQWSYSTWQTYNQCPKKVYYKKVLKLKEPESPQMLRGTRMHKIAEDFVSGRTEALFDQYGNDLELFRTALTNLRKQKPQCELEWGLTETWQPCRFDDPKAWLRLKTDVLLQPKPYCATVIDHKTGKIYPDHEQQLRLYALCAFLMLPHVIEVTVQDWYFDQDATSRPKIFMREELAALKVEWEEKSFPLLHDDIFPCRPGPLCRYCHFRKSNNGPCEF